MEIIPVETSKDPRRIAETAPILVAHQPEFLPYLGNIAKATMGDVYVCSIPFSLKSSTGKAETGSG